MCNSLTTPRELKLLVQIVWGKFFVVPILCRSLFWLVFFMWEATSLGKGPNNVDACRGNHYRSDGGIACPTAAVCNHLIPPNTDPSIPSRYYYPTAETMSVNGSSQDGRCSSVLSSSASYSMCEAPTSSVLFDGKIPTLNGLDGDMWASQLLVLQIHNPEGQFLVSDFNGTSNYEGVGRVELVMFNCPEWGIAVQDIQFLAVPHIMANSFSVDRTFSPTTTSCDSLVRVCVSIAFTDLVIFLQFIPAPGSNRTYLAEVEFYGDSSACIPDTIVTTRRYSGYKHNLIINCKFGFVAILLFNIPVVAVISVEMMLCLYAIIAPK